MILIQKAILFHVVQLVCVLSTSGQQSNSKHAFFEALNNLNQPMS